MAHNDDHYNVQTVEGRTPIDSTRCLSHQISCANIVGLNGKTRNKKKKTFSVMVSQTERKQYTGKTRSPARVTAVKKCVDNQPERENDRKKEARKKKNSLAILASNIFSHQGATATLSTATACRDEALCRDTIGHPSGRFHLESPFPTGK